MKGLLWSNNNFQDKNPHFSMTSQEHTEATHCIFIEGVESLNSAKYKNSTKFNNCNMRLN